VPDFDSRFGGIEASADPNNNAHLNPSPKPIRNHGDPAKWRADTHFIKPITIDTRDFFLISDSYHFLLLFIICITTVLD